MVLTGADIFAEVLVEQGVETLFGYPGGAVLNLYDALYKYSGKIRHIMTAHEQGAAHAADGYARATGKTGVVLATSGPGATNLVTGIATAYMDSIPMVAITGNVGTSLIGRDSFQEVYIAGITMPITKHNFVVRKVDELADILRDAFRIAQTGRKGPVLVDIPKDVTGATAEFTPVKPQIPVYKTELDGQELARAAQVIGNARRPVIYFGGGVAASEAGEELYALAKKAEIPATYTMMAAGVLSYGDPLNLGLLGMHGCRTTNRAVNEADLVLAIGTRFSDRVALNTEKFAKNAAILQIDIDPSDELPVITVIFNNTVLGMVRQWQTAFYGKRYSSTDPHRKTNYVKLAEGFGAKGYHCETLDAFSAAFAEALKSKGPVWIECVIDKDEKVLPMIPAGGSIEDMIMD